MALLTEGDLDRGRPADLTHPHWRCGIVDPATGAAARSALMPRTNNTRATKPYRVPDGPQSSSLGLVARSERRWSTVTRGLCDTMALEASELTVWGFD
jgi:hypothetical protein